MIDEIQILPSCLIPITFSKDTASTEASMFPGHFAPEIMEFSTSTARNYDSTILQDVLPSKTYKNIMISF